MLIETLKIQNGVICNLGLHNERMYRSRKELLGMDRFEDISLLAEVQNIPASEAVIKVRIIYAEKIIRTEWDLYKRKTVRSLKLVEDNEIEYKYKFEDRACINELYLKRDRCDDIIIVKNGRLTDSSFSNLAFSDGRRWVTPDSPLLSGTKRRQLLDEGILTEEELKVADLKCFKSCNLINALNDMGETEVKIFM